MTKKVRIENADTSHYKLKVEVFDKNPDGDVLVDTKVLDNPADLTEVYIHSGRYIKVSEA